MQEHQGEKIGLNRAQERSRRRAAGGGRPGGIPPDHLSDSCIRFIPVWTRPRSRFVAPGGSEPACRFRPVRSLQISLQIAGPLAGSGAGCGSVTGPRSCRPVLPAAARRAAARVRVPPGDFGRGRDRRRMDVRRRTRAVPCMRRSALPSVLSGRIRPPAVFSGGISISRYVARFDVSYRIPGAVRTLTPAWVKFSGPADALPLCRPLPLICLLAP